MSDDAERYTGAERADLVHLVHRATNFQREPGDRASAAIEAARKLQRLAETLTDGNGKHRRCRACGNIAKCATCGGVNP